MITDVVLFMGPPGTLKTFLSARLAARVGMVYLPTSAVGRMPDIGESAVRSEVRRERYRRLGRLVRLVIEQGGQVVVDGGFLAATSRQLVLDECDGCSTVVVYCHGAEEDLESRLTARSLDRFDHESGSAAGILATGADQELFDHPAQDVPEGRVAAVLEVDTTRGFTRWHGDPPYDVKDFIPDLIRQLLVEHGIIARTRASQPIIDAFDEFAGDYDNTTEWRKDPRLLGAMYRPLGHVGRIADLGCGTGLVGSRYRQEGHVVVGLDLSYRMLERAVPRETVAIVGSVEELPFLSDYFDVILLRQVLHYVDVSRTLSEAARVLKNRGAICLAQTVSRGAACAALWRDLVTYTQPRRHHVFTKADLEAAIEGASLKIDQGTELDIHRRDDLGSIRARGHEPSNGWVKFLERFEGTARGIDADLRFEFKDDTISYIQHWVVLWAMKS